MLDRDDAARGETAAIAGTVDFIDDRDFRVARPDEIGVQGVALAIILHGAIRRCQGLRDDLATEDAGPFGFPFRGKSTEEINLQTLDFENP